MPPVSRPRGWLGTGLTQTNNTLDILAEQGVTYCGDWNNDDQPYRMKVKTGKMIGIPYCMEINDIPLFIRKGYTGEQYYRSVMDQFEGPAMPTASKHARVMGIPLHPMIIGQPLRAKYLARALAEMKKHDKVWFATGSEIIDAYERATPDRMTPSQKHMPGLRPGMIATLWWSLSPHRVVVAPGGMPPGEPAEYDAARQPVLGKAAL